ncbi:MAG: hypothetical protein QXV47_07335 [Fervidicoccaceae archaeon]
MRIFRKEDESLREYIRRLSQETGFSESDIIRLALYLLQREVEEWRQAISEEKKERRKP